MREIHTYRPNPFWIIIGILVIFLLLFFSFCIYVKDFLSGSIIVALIAIISLVTTAVALWKKGKIDIGKRIRVYDTHIEVTRKLYPLSMFRGFNDKDEFVFDTESGRETVAVRWQDYPKTTKDDVQKLINSLQ